MKLLFSAFASLVLIAAPAFAYDSPPPDGEYEADVTTRSGTYRVPVEVQGGEVTHVEWPNGGRMSVTGGELDRSGEASGYDSRGNRVTIQVSP